MSETQKVLLKARIEVTARQLVAVWVLTILIPVLILSIGSDFFLGEYVKYARAGAIEDGLWQVDQFRSMLVPEQFLQSRVEKIKTLKLDNSQRTDALQDLKSQIDQVLQARSVFCAFYRAGGQQMQIVADKPEDIARNPLPLPFIRYITSVALTDVNYANPHELQQFLSEQKVAAQRAQYTFRTIAPIQLKLDQAVKNFSVYFGGELYFVLVQFDEALAEFDGALIMVRGVDMAIEEMVENARKMLPECDLPFIKYDLQEIHHAKQTFASKVVVDDTKITILAPVAQNFLRHYLHSGGVRLTSDDLSRVPFIRFNTDIRRRNAGIVDAIDLAKLSGWLVGLFSGLWTLKSCLLGMSFSPGFRAKILALSLVAAILPFALFVSSLYLHQQHLLILSRINLVQHLENRISQINDQLVQFQSYVEAETDTTVTEIFASVLPGDTEAVDIALSEMAQRLPFTKVIYYDKDIERSLELADRVSSVGSRQNPDFLLSFLARTSLRALEHDQSIQVDRSSLYRLNIQGNPMRTSSINDGLNAAGRMFPISFSQLPQWYVLRPVILPASGAITPLAALIIQFESGALLDAFFKSRTGVFKELSESAFGYNIRYGFYPVASTGSTHVWSGHYPDRLLGNDADPSKSPRSEISFSQSDSTESVKFSRINNLFPHLARAIAVRDDSDDLLTLSLYKILVAGAIFLVLVFYIADQLLKIMFLGPTLAMAKAARAIAKGGDRWDLNLTTNDEFSRLNNSFSTMVEGLQQRNMLKDYVADSAISEAEKQVGMQLSPGGENREVSVLFAAIKNFSEITSSMVAEEVVQLINEFVGVTDVAARENGGEIDKIIEGTVMIVFRSMAPDDISHAINALKAAERIAATMKQSGRDLCAGISSGNVISGRIGSYEGKLDYTVIGDTVNLAARLKAEASHSETGIIVSGATMRLLKGRARVRFLRRCRLKGKSREYNIYEFDSFRGV